MLSLSLLIRIIKVVYLVDINFTFIVCLVFCWLSGIYSWIGRCNFFFIEFLIKEGSLEVGREDVIGFNLYLAGGGVRNDFFGEGIFNLRS